MYNYACLNVERLLQNVYLEYQEFTRKQGRCIMLVIKKCDIATTSATTTAPVMFGTNNENIMKNMEVNKNGRMEPDQIEHFL